MCHHYKLDAIADDLWIAFKSFMSSYHEPLPTGGYYPTKPVPVLRDGELLAMEWGLLPPWWTPSEKVKSRGSFQRKTFNAKSETVHEKPSYRSAFKSRRCLVPVTHFEEKGHYFSTGKVFAFAGLWESWRDEVLSCTILTTEPNAEVQSVGHHRMPVLLQNEDEYSLWLNPDIDSREPLEKLFEPTENGLLVVEKIPK